MLLLKDLGIKFLQKKEELQVQADINREVWLTLKKICELQDLKKKERQTCQHQFVSRNIIYLIFRQL